MRRPFQDNFYYISDAVLALRFCPIAARVHCENPNGIISIVKLARNNTKNFSNVSYLILTTTLGRRCHQP